MKQLKNLIAISILCFCYSSIQAQSNAQLNITFSTERASVSIPGDNEFDVLESAGPGYVTGNGIYTPNTIDSSGAWVALNLRFIESGPLPLINTDFVVTYPPTGFAGGQVTNVTSGGCYVGQPGFNIAMTRNSPAPDAGVTPVIIATIDYPATHTGETITVRNTTTQACASRESFWSNTFLSNGATRILIGGSTTIVLPIKLTSFSGSSNNCITQLNWQTATEEAGSYYSIEYSEDGSSYKQIATVQSKNSATGSVYNYTDKSAATGAGYYRLKSIGKDGAATTSNVVTIFSSCSAVTPIILAPNPAKDKVTISGLSGNNDIIIVDITGQQLTHIVSTGTDQTINVSSFAKGIYLVRIIDANENVTNVKLIKD